QIVEIRPQEFDYIAEPLGEVRAIGARLELRDGVKRLMHLVEIVVDRVKIGRQRIDCCCGAQQLSGVSWVADRRLANGIQLRDNGARCVAGTRNTSQRRVTVAARPASAGAFNLAAEVLQRAPGRPE